MSDLHDPVDDHATPIDDDERRGLKLTYITTKAQLNEAEQIGILNAMRWAFSPKKPRPAEIILNDEFLCSLHKKMFNDVWRWAGMFRTTEKNIGVLPHMIRQDLRVLLDDVKCWIEFNTYEPDEVAVRFHHRLVSIHLFPNGNGRHARLSADLLAVALKRARFTWGRGDLIGRSEVRNRYIAALRAADGHDIGPLLAFVRS